MATRGAIAIAGNKASPSLLMALPSADNGMMPDRYMVLLEPAGHTPV